MKKIQKKDNDKVIFILSLVFLLLCFLVSLKSADMFMWDEAEYALTGYNIAYGLPYGNALRPPMLGTLTAPLIFFTNGSTDFPIRLLMVLISWSTLGFVGWMVLKMSNATTALFTGVFLGFMPWYWANSSHFLAEIPFLLFSTLSLLFFYGALYKNEKYFHGVWIFCGFAFLTRYTALLLGPIFILLLILLLFQDKEKLKSLFRKKVFWLSPFWLLLIMSPWLIHHEMVYGDFLIGFKIAKNQLPSYVPQLSMPWYYYGSVLPSMIGIPLGILSLIGVIDSIYHKKRLGVFSLVIVLFFFMWFSQYRYKEPRLISASLPFIAILSALGYQFITTKFKFLSDRMATLVVIGIISFISYAYIYNGVLNNKTIGYPNLLEMASILSETTDKEDLIMAANTPQLKWYAQRQTTSFPGNFDGFKERLNDTDWVVIVNYEKGQPEYILNEIIPLIQASLEQFPSLRTVISEQGYFSLMVNAYELATIIK